MHETYSWNQHADLYYDGDSVCEDYNYLGKYIVCIGYINEQY